MSSITEIISHGEIGAKNAGRNVVIIDVFRADTHSNCNLGAKAFSILHDF